jgi:hypothetical protein
MKQGEEKIEFKVVRLAKCLNHISEMNNVVSAIYHSTKDFLPQNILPLETDGLAYVFPNDKGEVDISPNSIMDWVFRKAFDDFTIGISQTLIEVCRFLGLTDVSIVSKDNPFLGKEAMEEALELINDAPNKFHFPVLLKKIETALGTTLPYKEELLSINQVRNCLVHRAGIVSKHDLNDTQNSTLVLRYQDLILYIQKAGTVMELTWAAKQDSPYIENMGYQYVPKTVSFSLNERVIIDANIFKALVTTTILFSNELILRLPLSDEIKSVLVKPLNIQLMTR